MINNTLSKSLLPSIKNKNKKKQKNKCFKFRPIFIGVRHQRKQTSVRSITWNHHHLNSCKSFHMFVWFSFFINHCIVLFRDSVRSRDLSEHHCVPCFWLNVLLNTYFKQRNFGCAQQQISFFGKKHCFSIKGGQFITFVTHDSNVLESHKFTD